MRTSNRFVHKTLALATLGIGLMACTGTGVTQDGNNGGGKANGALKDGAGATLPVDTSCSGTPDADPVDWNHPIESPLIATGTPHHRMIDLIASAQSATQTIGGRMAYGLDDKSLEDEVVQVFACIGGNWSSLGTSTTDDEGRYTLTLSGTQELPLGLRSLAVVALGDLSSAPGVALVSNSGASVAVSDVDGTLTSSENAFPESLVTGDLVQPNDGAPAALGTLAQLGYPLVYVTSRGDLFTQNTRDWLAGNGFPLGPVRLASSLITIPGDATVAYKSGVLQGISDGGLTVAIGLGNRASDQMAYANASVAAAQTFLKIPEFISEIQPLLDAGLAVGNPSYVDIQSTFAALPAAP